MNAPRDVWNISADEFPADATSEEKPWFVVRYAVLATSSHNAQPWKFRIHGDIVGRYRTFGLGKGQAAKH